uniref:BTB domain-containing protein n=1 Tax=Setaria italica TaxID=4555 RepID=K4A2U8_SETIT
FCHGGATAAAAGHRDVAVRQKALVARRQLLGDKEAGQWQVPQVHRGGRRRPLLAHRLLPQREARRHHRLRICLPPSGRRRSRTRRRRRRRPRGVEVRAAQGGLRGAAPRHNRFVIRCDFTVFPTAGATPAVARPSPPQPSVQQAAPPAAGASRAPPPSSPLPAAPPAVRALRSMSGLPADLGRLLETEAGSDVDFEVCGRVFAAHKVVLAARSPVFMADFFGPDKEKTTGYIRICDMHPDAFEALLHYIYTDTLPATATAREEAAALAQDLLVAADRFNLKDLKSLTENKLCRHSVSVSTVLPMLALAEHHQCLNLKKKCLEFIASGRNTRAVMATDDVEHLARSCPSVVREILGKILDAREATPSNPLMVSVDASFYFYACIFILLFGLWALFCVYCV